MKLLKKGLLLPTVMGLVFVLGGCVSSDEVAEAILGTVNVSGTIVDASNNDAPLQDVSVQATTDGIPGTTNNYDSSTVSTDASGNFSLSVAKDLPVYLRLNKAGYATFNSAFTSFSGTTAIGEIPMITTVDAEAVIDAAFPTGGLNLADKAWLIVEVYDAAGDDLAGVTVAPSNSPVSSAYNNQNTCVNDYDAGVGPTIDCTATRVGPMYIAYYDTEQVVNVFVNGALVDDQAALVRVGEIAVVVFEQ